MKIALGMSGGIDSSMCAMILKEMGHDVIGITMAKWNPSSGIISSDKRGCFGPTEPKTLEAAKRSAEVLGIEHHIINLEDDFRDCVLSYYTQDYVAGKTPNPCVVCNREIKFGMLIQKARDLGINFDRFATGHYARIIYNAGIDRYQLLRAVDHRKDQSYFLSMLSQEQLAISMFPLGGMYKDEIKAFARAKGFGYLEKKKESQDFLESLDSSPLFAENSYAPGAFEDLAGRVLGQHKGLIHYTIGQRKGLGLAGFDRPRYVIGMDYERNRVIIGEEQELYRKSLLATNMSWLSIPEPAGAIQCSARIRLAQTPQKCLVQKQENGGYLIQFEEPVSAITPGQVVALYQDDLVLGAGFIISPGS